MDSCIVLDKKLQLCAAFSLELLCRLDQARVRALLEVLLSAGSEGRVSLDFVQAKMLDATFRSGFFTAQPAALESF